MIKIKTKEIPIYFLTTGKNEKRRNHILEIFKDYNINEVNPLLGISRFKSGSIGMSRIIDIGLRNQDRKKQFQPFLLVEDDVSFYRDIPDEFEIPEDSDLFYLGISRCGSIHDRDTTLIFAKDYNQNIVRIFNMLSCHGILIASALGASLYQRCMAEAYYKNKPWDIPLSHCQKFYKCYAFKKPFFYQDKNYGGQQNATKFTLEEYIDKNYPTFDNCTDSIKFVKTN
jgi:hypothetical protein